MSAHVPAAPRTAAVVGRPDVAAFETLAGAIRRTFDVQWIDTQGTEDLSRLEVDLVFVLGGDGTILRAARRMGQAQKPVVGVNLGRLGFLADLNPEALVRKLPLLAAGQFQVVEHLMLRCQVRRSDQVLVDALGLNETAVLAGPPFSMLDIDLYVDAELVTTYSCDGLIVSTPVGSTAHSLSAGGPILRKELQAFVVAPISPHTLTIRPVVDSADRHYEMVVNRPNPGTSVVIDGQLVHTMAAGDRVCVQKARPTFKLVDVPGHGFYNTLREKLGWGGRIRNTQP